VRQSIRCLSIRCLSIRWRLTLWIAAALAVVLACFAALVYGMLRHALLEQTDRLLAAAFGQLAGDPRVAAETDGRVRYWIEEYKDHQNLLCGVYRAGGTVHARSPELTEPILPAPALTAGRAVSNELLPGIGQQRVMAERLRLGGQDFVVVILAPLEAVDRELNHVAGVLGAAGAATWLLSAALAYGLARKALAPVDQLRRATDAITADRLDRRLPVANPDDELGRLAGTINTMIARLERSFAEVRRFTADASHELRTPLTVLRTEVEVALGKPLAPPEQQQLLGNVLDELVRMSRLTDQLLALSRRDAGMEQGTVAPLPLHTLVAGVVDALRPLAEAKGVGLGFEAEAPVSVAGDEGRLRQVFINLLDNALKYTPEGGTVTVRVERRGPAVAVVVADTGIGIAPEHLPHVFDRFYRVDRARSRAEGGTGLGLSIAQSIVRAHRGTIEIASTLGRGTVCTVTLPHGDGSPGNGVDADGTPAR
jgi:two-component system, OmpR family, heavy metal sensor histidine kinase CusS